MGTPPIFILQRPRPRGWLGALLRFTDRVGLTKASRVVSEVAGPLDRATMVGQRTHSTRNPNSVAALQAMYRQNAILRAVVDAIVSEVFRNGIEVVDAYAARCASCGYETEDDEEAAQPLCPRCMAGNMEEPDPAETDRLKDAIKSVNPNGQRFEDLLRALLVDWLVVDDGWLRFRYEYLMGPDGAVAGTRLLETWRLDPFSTEWSLQDDGRIGGRWLTCVAHRDHLVPYGDGSKTCPECRAALYDVRVVAYDRLTGQESELKRYPYIEGEVRHRSFFSPGTPYGMSMIVSLWHQLDTTLAQDEYLNKVFEMQRPLDGVVVITTDNPETVDAKMSIIEERKRKNPNYMPTIAVKRTAGAGDTIQFVKFDIPLHEMQSLEHRKEMVKRILAAYGAPPLIMADIEDAGGLNNESQQRERWTDRIEGIQVALEGSFMQDFRNALGVTGAKLRFMPLREEDEGLELDNRQKRLNLAQQAQAMGYSVHLKDADTLEFEVTEGGGGPGGSPFPVALVPGEQRPQEPTG